MICIFDTDSKDEAHAVAAALDLAGISYFLDGQSTASLPGFYVPRVLRVCVTDASHAPEAKRLASQVIREMNISHSRQRQHHPKRWGAVLVLGALLIAAGVLATLFALVARFQAI
jgi:hypothetical protein